METKKYLNKKQAASMLGVCVITITKLVSNGELQAIKSCKKKWRFKEDDLKKYISIVNPDTEKLSQVRLTYKVLEMYGLTTKPRKVTNKTKISFIDFCSIYNEGGNVTFKLTLPKSNNDGSESIIEIGNPIKYLHELQNIQKALFGEEYKIKK